MVSRLHYMRVTLGSVFLLFVSSCLLTCLVLIVTMNAIILVIVIACMYASHLQHITS
ncbi:hypothetical protein BDF19DRAFT_449085 [Syncephalis fuscata]|nr:hypothetical protein BDF19DRAFT_449085 [Syncephalis fuscata]